VTPELREKLQGAAVRLGRLAKYRSAGTVEYIVDDDTGEFYFLEVNTRLQVRRGGVAGGRVGGRGAGQGRSFAFEGSTPAAPADTPAPNGGCSPCLSWPLPLHVTADLLSCCLPAPPMPALLLLLLLPLLLQVEHGITEMITGVDLVAMQFELQVGGA
jgi:hypothetical protein